MRSIHRAGIPIECTVRVTVHLFLAQERELRILGAPLTSVVVGASRVGAAVMVPANILSKQ